MKCHHAYEVPRPANLLPCVRDAGHSGPHKTWAGLEWPSGAPVPVVPPSPSADAAEGEFEQAMIRLEEAAADSQFWRQMALTSDEAPDDVAQSERADDERDVARQALLALWRGAQAEVVAMEKLVDQAWEREQGDIHKALDDLGIPSSVHGPGKWYDGSIARIRTALTGSDYSVLGSVEADGVVRVASGSISVGSRVRVVLLRGGESEALSNEFQRAALAAHPTEAESVEGVVAIDTHRDLVGEEGSCWVFLNTPLLPRTRVRVTVLPPKNAEEGRR